MDNIGALVAIIKVRGLSRQSYTWLIPAAIGIGAMDAEGRYYARIALNAAVEVGLRSLDALGK